RAQDIHRNYDDRTLLVGEALPQCQAGKFGDVDLLAARHAVEDRARLIDGDEIEIDAFDLDLAGIERLHAVVEPARERKLQLGHLLRPRCPERSSSFRSAVTSRRVHGGGAEIFGHAAESRSADATIPVSTGCAGAA